MAVLAVKWVALLIPILLLLSLCVVKQAIPARREISKISSTSKAPLLSHFIETRDGLLTIKAFGKEK